MTTSFHWVPGKAEQLTWFRDSPDTGDPACVCSLCEKVIGEGEMPLRVIRDTADGRGEEIRLHIECARQVIVELAPPDPKDPAFAEGRAAHDRDVSRGSNPYPHGKKRAAWWAGWDQGWEQRHA